jgi:hypothetical protein
MLPLCGGIMPQVGEAGKRILREGGMFRGSIDRGIASLYCPSLYVA